MILCVKHFPRCSHIIIHVLLGISDFMYNLAYISLNDVESLDGKLL